MCTRQIRNSKICKAVCGYLCAFGCSFVTILEFPAGQALGDRVPPFETNLIRFITQLLFITAIVVIFRIDPRFPLEKWNVITLVLSSITVYGAGVLFIMSSWYLPVAALDALMENIVMVLAFFVAVFSGYFNVVFLIAVIVTSMGSLLMFQPYFIFHGYAQDLEDELMTGNSSSLTECNTTMFLTTGNTSTPPNCPPQDSTDNNTAMAIILVLCLSLCFWINEQFFTPRLSKRVDVHIIIFWVSLGAFILSVPTLFAGAPPILITDATDIVLVLLIAIPLSLGTYFVMVAVTLIHPTLVAIILPSAVIFLFIAQKTILNDIQPGPGNWLEIFGLILVIIGSVMPPIYDIIKLKMKAKCEENQAMLQSTEEGDSKHSRYGSFNTSYEDNQISGSKYDSSSTDNVQDHLKMSHDSNTSKQKNNAAVT